ncbi:hypothetical protein BASA81_007551 [Batrachochytrium salamandrivorans]|nr:hypothetical protein BASA81_007551 [Batrachochytrium salamandrivorans]
MLAGPKEPEGNKEEGAHVAMDLEQQALTQTKDGSEKEDEDNEGGEEMQFEEFSAFAHRCDCICSAFCSAMGSCIRALFASSILALTIFVFIIIIQAAWGVFSPTNKPGPKPLSPEQRYSRNDEIAHTFPLCANEKRTMHPFIRNICWRTNMMDDQVSQFALLISRSLMDLEITELGRKRLFVIDALYTEGNTLDGEQITMRNMPAAAKSSANSVFRFNPSPDSQFFCDVKRESTWLEEPLQEGVLVTMPILKLEDDEVWLDATTFIKRLMFTVQSPSTLLRKQGWTAPVDSIRITSASVFPRNAIVRVEISTSDLHDVSRTPLVQSIAFSLILLAETSEPAREAHNAIGYFTSSIRLNQPRTTNGDVLVRGGGNRIRMVNRRSNFLFYIDPTVPVEYRQAVKHGVEMWNLALAPVNRIMRVVLPTDTDWPKDYSVADVRYSTISWSVNLDVVFAIGPSTVDPRSGEILNSAIVLSDKWLFAWNREIEASKSSSSRLQNCQKQARFAAASSLLSAVNSTAFLLAGLSDVVAHEVGHALGLRHNFKGSLQVPFDKLHNAQYQREFGLSASVMDYLDLNPHFLNSELAFTQRVGSYDLAAIRFAYDQSVDLPLQITTTFGTRIELASNAHLHAIAMSAGAFGTDEDFMDPEAAIFDLSSNPLLYAETQMDLVLRLRPQVVRQHEMNRVDLVHRLLSSQLISAARTALGYVGGKIVKSRGGWQLEGARSEFVSQDNQLAAVKLVLKLCISRLEYFPKTSWFRTCEQPSSSTCLYEGQLVQVDYKQDHSLPIKLGLVRELVGDLTRLQRMDEDGSPLSSSKLLDVVVQHLFDPVQDAHLWDLQSEYISTVLELFARAPHRPKVWIKVSLEHVLTAFRKRTWSSSPEFTAHAELCQIQINQALSLVEEEKATR